jgi:hypothetical protein
MASFQLRKREEYQTLKDKLWSDRQPLMVLWQEIEEYAKPGRLRITTNERNRPKDRAKDILDNTATLSLDRLESFLYSGMSAQTRPWFKLTTPDPELSESGAVKTYLHEVERRLNAVLILSNFYNACPEVYGDVSTYGTAAMACFEDDEDVLRFYTYPLGSYAIGLDRRREVCTFVLEEQFTVRQVVTEFGVLRDGKIANPENFSQAVRTAWDDKRYEDSVECCWIVMPNNQADPTRLNARYLPFTSCWFEVGRQEHDGVLRESGFRSFPVMAPRWKVTGNDAYGMKCPGMLIKGDVKQLQRMERKGNQWLDKFIDPAITGPSSLKASMVSLLPGHYTGADPRDQSNSLRPIHELRVEGMQHFDLKQEQVRSRIRGGCFEQLFLSFQSNPYGQPMTAEEAKLRDKEKLVLLPALERLNEEFLERVVDRGFDVLSDARMLPEPPEELRGMRLPVHFTSVLAEQMKVTRAVGLDRFAATVLPMAGVLPDIIEKIDAMEMVDEYGEALGVSPKVIRSTEAAIARITERARQQQEAAAAQQAKDMSTALKNAGTTPMTGDTALTRAVEMAGAL